MDSSSHQRIIKGHRKRPTRVKQKQNRKTEIGSDKRVSKSSSKVNIEGIPDACDLLSIKTIAKFVKQPAGQIILNDGSSSLNPKARACFFKWDSDDDLPNAGVMVQVQKNPVHSEIGGKFTN